MSSSKQQRTTKRQIILKRVESIIPPLLQRLIFLSTYQGQRVDECVDVSHARRCDDLVHGDLATIVTVLNVLTDAAVEQHRLLRDETNVRAKPLNAELSDVMTVNHLTHTATLLHCVYSM